MTKIFGNYVEKEVSQEYLIISFSSETLPIKDRWRNNSLSADFLADYWGTFFPKRDSESPHQQAEVRDAVGYLSNELLENAIKFSCERSGIPIQIGLYLSSNTLRFYVTNAVRGEEVEQFQEYIQLLLTENPNDLYIQRLEQNAEEDDSGSSGLGYLTMLNDYEAQLGWKFKPDALKPETLTVTTMVEIEVQRKTLTN